MNVIIKQLQLLFSEKQPMWDKKAHDSEAEEPAGKIAAQNNTYKKEKLYD